MKNLFIGLLLGAILTAVAFGFNQKDEQSIKNGVTADAISARQAEEPSNKMKNIEDQPLDIKSDYQRIINVSEGSTESLASLSKVELVSMLEEQRQQIAGLADTVKTQKAAIEKLNDERERPRTPFSEENLTPEQATAALNNIRTALETADPEYKEVLESALNLFQDEKLITPSNDALLRHYAEEPEIQWATTAQAWLGSYFQNGIEPDINLIQLNCRATYCELYGFYGSDQTINDYRIPGAKISNYFREMADAAGYKTLFRNAENISLNTSSDNTFMSFHVFIRSVN